MARSAEKTEKTWYDYPEYYDVGFRDQIKEEASFFEAAFERYVPFPVKSLLEPGSGSGRLVLEMASRGYKVTGLDLNQTALDYTQKQLTKRKLKATLRKADMTDFSLPKKVDAAFNPINTFRHLLTEDLAIKHLQLMADHLRVGGIYIIGLHLLPPDADLTGAERWKAKSGKTNISYSLRVMEASRRTRVERLKITMNIQTPTKKLRLHDEFQLRLYTATQIKKLFAKVPDFRLVNVFDFWYQIDEPQPLNNELVDAVFILQKQ